MNERVVLPALVVLLGSACDGNVAGSPKPQERTIATESPTTMTTTPEPSGRPFTISVHAVIAQINL
jgi:hypothetical protein